MMTNSDTWVSFISFSVMSVALVLYQRRKKSTLTTTVSCPGKVLICGGYLILDRKYDGVTIAASSARFYTTVKPFAINKQNIRQEDKQFLHIVVDSPQFYKTYEYNYNYASIFKGNDRLSPVRSFDEIVDRKLKINDQGYLLNSLSITLQANNDFYSQTKELQKRGLALLSQSLKTLPDFMPCPKDALGNVEVSKTGMGSSAALTSSLIGALLQWFEEVNLHSSRVARETDLALVHNLSQIVHANAQGKIGSGFDVAAAIYGTNQYRRFSPDWLNPCMQDIVNPEILRQAATEKSHWDQEIVPFQLPPYVDLILGDICSGGSSSSSMAREVIKWRKEQPQVAEILVGELATSNSHIFDKLQELNHLSKVDRSTYDEALRLAKDENPSEWYRWSQNRIIASLSALRSHFDVSRSLLKKIGVCAGVDIEPDSQTELADATQSLKGVIASGVPGAGGVDALFALIIEKDQDTSVRNAVENMWSNWGETTGRPLVCALMLKASVTKQNSGIILH